MRGVYNTRFPVFGALFKVRCALRRVLKHALWCSAFSTTTSCTERSPAAQQRTEAAANERGRGGRQRARLEEHGCGVPSSDRSIPCFTRVYFVPQRLVSQTRTTQAFGICTHLGGIGRPKTTCRTGVLVLCLV